MARRKKETVERTIKLKQSELKAAILDASRHKANAATHSGFHGRAVQQFCERTSFDRTVFGWLRKLHDVNDELKRQAMIRQLLMGVSLLDWNKQGDLFDDVQEEIANKADLDDSEDGDDDFETKDVRPPFMQNAIPLEEAEQKFDAAKEVAAAKESVAKKKAAKPDALGALAGTSDSKLN